MMDTLLLALHAIGMALVPVVGTWIGSHVKNAYERQAIDMAVQRGGGIAYHYMAARAGGMPAAQARVQAIEVATDYVMRGVPGILTHLGVTNAAVRDMVTGELGKLFAADPNIAVVAPIPAQNPLAPPPPPPPARMRSDLIPPSPPVSVTEEKVPGVPLPPAAASA
jgi:hypothetical protein